MAKTEQEKVGKPISVRFKTETMEKLSRIRIALQDLGGANVPLSGMIVAAVDEYIRSHWHLIAEQKRPKPRR